MSSGGSDMRLRGELDRYNQCHYCLGLRDIR
jgi:hypothetical protein